MKFQSEAAEAVYRHVGHYLAGCLNERAMESWELALGDACRDGKALDSALHDICQAYLARHGTRSNA